MTFAYLLKAYIRGMKKYLGTIFITTLVVGCTVLIGDMIGLNLKIAAGFYGCLTYLSLNKKLK